MTKLSEIKARYEDIYQNWCIVTPGASAPEDIAWLIAEVERMAQIGLESEWVKANDKLGNENHELKKEVERLENLMTLDNDLKYIDVFSKGVDYGKELVKKENARLREALEKIANNGIEFMTDRGPYLVDVNPNEVAQKALRGDDEKG